MFKATATSERIHITLYLKEGNIFMKSFWEYKYLNWIFSEY